MSFIRAISFMWFFFSTGMDIVCTKQDFYNYYWINLRLSGWIKTKMTLTWKNMNNRNFRWSVRMCFPVDNARTMGDNSLPAWKKKRWFFTAEAPTAAARYFFLFIFNKKEKQLSTFLMLMTSPIISLRYTSSNQSE